MTRNKLTTLVDAYSRAWDTVVRPLRAVNVPVRLVDVDGVGCVLGLVEATQRWGLALDLGKGDECDGGNDGTKALHGSGRGRVETWRRGRG
jgi:hypothetical protein